MATSNLKLKNIWSQGCMWQGTSSASERPQDGSQDKTDPQHYWTQCQNHEAHTDVAPGPQHCCVSFLPQNKGNKKNFSLIFCLWKGLTF